MFNDLRIRKSAHPASRLPASRFLLALGIFIAFTACGGATTDAGTGSGTAAAPLLVVSNAKVRGLLPGRNSGFVSESICFTMVWGTGTMSDDARNLRASS